MLYNIFNPHIIEWCCGGYSVRAWGMFRWHYYSSTGGMAYPTYTKDENVNRYCYCATLYAAEKVLARVSGKRVCRVVY